MTKLLLCINCMDFVSPFRINGIPRPCMCGNNVVWWEDSQRGIIRVWSPKQDCFVIGIHNQFLQMTEYSKEAIDKLLNETESFYLFHTLHTPMVKIYPGTTKDTAFSATIPIFTKQLDDRHKPYCEKIIPLEGDKQE